MCTFESGPAISARVSGTDLVKFPPGLRNRCKLAHATVDAGIVLSELAVFPNPALRTCVRECDYFAEWVFLLVSTAFYNLQRSLAGTSARKRWRRASADKTVKYVNLQPTSSLQSGCAPGYQLTHLNATLLHCLRCGSKKVFGTGNPLAYVNSTLCNAVPRSSALKNFSSSPSAIRMFVTFKERLSA